MPKKLNVVGLGNALMDVLVRIPTNDIIDQNNLTVGVMHPVDDQRWQEVYGSLGELSKEEQNRWIMCKYNRIIGIVGCSGFLLFTSRQRQFWTRVQTAI